MLAFDVGLSFTLLPAPLSAWGCCWASRRAWDRWGEGGWRYPWVCRNKLGGISFVLQSLLVVRFAFTEQEVS